MLPRGGRRRGEFTKRDGTPVDFMARKPAKVETHVEFMANNNKKK